MDVTKLAFSWVWWPSGEKKASVDLHANFFPTKLSATVIASQLKCTKLLASATWTWQTQSQVVPSFQSPRLLVTLFGRAR